MRNQIAEPLLQKGEGLRKEISECVLDSDRWLTTPHELLGGREPIELLESGDAKDKERLRDLVESIKHGLFS